MNFTLLSSAVTLVSLVCFVGILYWAFKGSNKARFEALARIALETDAPAFVKQTNEADRRHERKHMPTRAQGKRV